MHVPLAVALLLCVVAPLCAQTLDELTTKLAAAATVDDAAVGDGGDKSETRRLYEQWRGLATAAQLRDFTNHTSPVLRAYAGKALVEIEATVDWLAIVREHLLDTAEVTTFEGCCLEKQFVGDVVFKLARPKLTDEQVLDVAEDLIAKKSPLFAREGCLRTLRLRDGMLHTVRALARGGDGPAAIALARYRLPVDVEVLADLLRTAAPFDDNCHFVAAEVHADPRLLAPLIAIEGKARQRLETDNPSRLTSWLRAIAAQRSPEAAAFLVRFLRESEPGERFREKDLQQTFKSVLVPHADCKAFDDVRAAIKRRIEANK